MKKNSILFTLMMTALTAQAGSSSHPQNEQDNTGIITPDVATGMYRTASYTYDANMDILVCRKDFDYSWGSKTCLDTNGKNQWRKISQAIPIGKTYVGFKSISQGSTHYIEVYWK